MTEEVPTAFRPRNISPRLLSELYRRLSLPGESNTPITGVSISAQHVQPGDLYAAVPGKNTHGARFASDAVARGAVAILTDAEGGALIDDSPVAVPVLCVPEVRGMLGEIAAWVYRTGVCRGDDPAGREKLLAVTGTNGKTSVVHLLAGIMTQLGVVSGISSTAERRIGERVMTSVLTTPEAPEVHALLGLMREEGVEAVAIEASAQALTRHRIDGIVFDVAGFTNFSHDHLDDYSSLEEYFQAKTALFTPAHAARAVITVDSEWGRRIAETADITVVTLTSIDQVTADWRMRVVGTEGGHTEFDLTGPGGQNVRTRVPYPGRHMACNAALAIVMLVEAGYGLDRIAARLNADGGIHADIPGRTELISGASGPRVYLDYGHSPDAYLQTLAAIRPPGAGRVIMVFGVDGDRDASKRAEMGAIAARGADVLVTTDMNPRFEDPASIRAALIAGARAAVPDRTIYEIGDPGAAFRFALTLADENDTILYAGPGHEDYHEVAGIKHPYSARDDSRQALTEAGWPA